MALHSVPRTPGQWVDFLRNKINSYGNRGGLTSVLYSKRHEENMKETLLFPRKLSFLQGCLIKI